MSRTGDIEMVTNYRLRRADDADERSGRVERTDLYLALERLLAWWPPERCETDALPGVIALRSLLGGDSVTGPRMSMLVCYCNDALAHYRARYMDPEEAFQSEARRAFDNFTDALTLLSGEPT